MPRLVSAVAIALLLVALAVAVSRTRTAGTAPGATPDPGPAPAVTATPSPSTSPSEPTDGEALLRDPQAAERAGAEALLAAGLEAAAGPWADLGETSWPALERPVYVGTATITDRSRVDADVVIAFRAEHDLDRLVLRLLPAASALSDVGGPPDVTVRRNGRVTPHEVDEAGARLVVPLDPPLGADGADVVRVLVSYTLVPREQVRDDGGPAGFGLLASNPTVSVLGHWLPLLTAPDNDGPMVPWGDVGAFPAAVWSLQVEHGDDVLVSGGTDGACPTLLGTEGCTWSRGVALRDVSAVLYGAGVHRSDRRATGVTVRAFGADPVAPGSVDLALAESVAGVELFTEAFGPLAWREFDVVAAPLSSGAAGMEFPGLVIIRDDTYASLSGGFGTYVIAHEVAHQWFHALLGNGSLSDPVVDESLAQYASVLYYAALRGEQAADELRLRYIDGRYDRWRAGGGAEEVPGQPLEDFADAAAYGPLVYARGAMAWLAAEEAVGRAAVVSFIAGLVREHGLARLLTDEEVVEQATAASEPLGAALRRHWFDPEPVR